MRHVAAQLKGRRPGLSLEDLAPERSGPGFRCRREGPDIVGVDGALGTVARRTVGFDRMRVRDASRDLSRVILTDALEMVLVCGERAVHVDVGRVDSALFLPDGRVLATARQRRPPGRRRSDGLRHRVCLVDPDSGTVLDEKELKVRDAVAALYLHPDGGSVVLDAGEGQDGSYLFAVTVTDAGLSTRRMSRDGVFGTFSPSGDRVLLLPHPTNGDGVHLRTWPGLRKVASLEIGDLDEECLEDDDFDVDGFYLREDLILLRTVEGRILTCSGDLEPLAWVDAEIPRDPNGFLSISQLIGLDQETIAVEAFEGEEGPTVSIWRIPTVLPPSAAGRDRS